MECPYCREVIRDGAIQCRHCGREFALLAPLVARVHALEEELADVRAELEEARAAARECAPSEAAARVERAAASAERRTVLTGILAGAATLWVAGILIWRGWLTVRDCAPVFVGVPLLVGVWLGLRLPGRRSRRYLTAGLAVGASLYAWAIVRRLLDGALTGMQADPAFVAVLLVGNGLLALSGGVLAQAVAQHVRSRRAQAGGRGSRPRVAPASTAPARDPIERVGRVLSAIAPALSLMGTLVGASLTYIATSGR